MKILLFGGTFDPPHKGHISILNSAYKAVVPDKTLIIPARIPPHKASACATKETRIAMCEAILPYVPFAELEPCELERSGASYTIDTVHYLQNKYSEDKLYFCLGSDMLMYFRKWREYKELLISLVLVVQMRDEADSENTVQMARSLEAEGASIIFTKAKALTASSTMVRELLVQGKNADEYVPLEVLEIIRQNNLYTKDEQL